MIDLDEISLKKLMMRQVEFSNNAKTQEIAAYHAGCALVYALMCDERIEKFGLHYNGGCKYETYGQKSLEVF